MIINFIDCPLIPETLQGAENTQLESDIIDAIVNLVVEWEL